MNLTKQKTIKLIPTAIVLFLILISGRSMMLEAAEDKYEIEWEIDRSAVPNLPIDDVTLNVAVGQANAISAVGENEEELSVIYNEETGVASITTAGNSIKLSFFTETAGNPLIGSFVPATLKYDYEWAWSHGIDDNANLEGSIRQFQKRDWAGTLFLIGKLVEDAASDTELMTEGRVQELMAEGWSIGNHSYDYEDCEPRPGTYEENILNGQAVLEEIMASSVTPEKVILSMAAPCFLNGFHPAMLSLQASGDVSLRINESGDNQPLILDSGALNEIVDNFQVDVFKMDSPVGRDGLIDVGTLDETIREIDWVARHSNKNRHLWYNSVSHGERDDNVGVEARLGGLVEYVYRTYGPQGTNEVWVAPSDHIVSYMTVRDLAEFKVINASRNSEPIENNFFRLVEPNSVGNLESSGFLPTRVRPVDTPIPIVVEIVEASTLVPTLEPTAVQSASATAVPASDNSQSAEIADTEIADSASSEEIDTLSDLDSQVSSTDNMANIAVWSVMIVAALISLTLLTLLAIFAFRFWRTRDRRS